MNKRELYELLRYSSPHSILVVSYKDEIIELHTPFIVEVKHDIGKLCEGMKVPVESIKLSWELKTVFVIFGTPYKYLHFSILID